MRKETITTTYTIYNFNELSEEVQKAAIDKYINATIDQRNDWYYEDCKEELKRLLPNSEAKLQYSLSYCQGDGLEIYGSIAWADLLEAVKEDLTEKEAKTIDHYLSEIDSYIELNPNRQYCYYHFNKNTFINAFEDSLYYSIFANINHETINKYCSLCNDYLEELSSAWETAGYDYLYNPDHDEIVDELSQYEYLKDGSMYN